MMPDNQGSNKKNEGTGTPPSDHSENRLLNHEINRIRQKVDELVDALEDPSVKLAALEQRVASIESNDLRPALAAHKEKVEKEINELKALLTISPATVAHHEHSEIQALRTDTQSLNTRLQSAEVKVTDDARRLQNVDDKLKEQNKHLINRIDRTGIVIGVLCGILALGSGLLTLPKTIKEFRSKPETQLVSGWPLEMSYDPTSKRIGFTFPLKVGNYGSKGDTIKEVRAVFQPASTPANKAHFITTGIKFTEKGLEVRTPFDVSTSSPRELVCAMTMELGENDPQSIIQPGLNRLRIELIADDEKTRGSADYCFWVMNSNVKDLLTATSLKAFTYVAPYPKCESLK